MVIIIIGVEVEVEAHIKVGGRVEMVVKEGGEEVLQLMALSVQMIHLV